MKSFTKPLALLVSAKMIVPEKTLFGSHDPRLSNKEKQ